MSNSSNNEFIADLESKFGLEGYARWWKMLEIIAAQMDETNRCYAEYSWSKWQVFLRARRKPLEQFLMFCQSNGEILLERSGGEVAEKSGRSPVEVAEKSGRSGTSAELLLKISCSNLLKSRDFTTAEYKKREKKYRYQEVEVEVEVDKEKDLKTLNILSKSEKPDSDDVEIPKPEIARLPEPKTVRKKKPEPKIPPPTEASTAEPRKLENPEPQEPNHETPDRPPDPQPPPPKPANGVSLDFIKNVLDDLNRVVGKRYTHKDQSACKYIRARAGEGARLEDFYAVNRKKAAEWGGTDMGKYIRPNTLYNSEKFWGYVNQPEAHEEVARIKNPSAFDRSMQAVKTFLEKGDASCRESDLFKLFQ